MPVTETPTPVPPPMDVWNCGGALITYFTVTFDTVGVFTPVEVSVTLYCHHVALDLKEAGNAAPPQVTVPALMVQDDDASVRFTHEAPSLTDDVATWNGHTRAR